MPPESGVTGFLQNLEITLRACVIHARTLPDYPTLNITVPRSTNIVIDRYLYLSRRESPMISRTIGPTHRDGSRASRPLGFANAKSSRRPSLIGSFVLPVISQLIANVRAYRDFVLEYYKRDFFEEPLETCAKFTNDKSRRMSRRECRSIRKYSLCHLLFP